MIILWLVTMVLLGLLMVLRPGCFWKAENLFSHSNETEPSQRYLTAMRVGGFVCIGGAVALALATLL